MRPNKLYRHMRSGAGKGGTNVDDNRAMRPARQAPGTIVVDVCSALYRDDFAPIQLQNRRD